MSQSKKVVIWGAGRLFHVMKKELGNMDIISIVDTNPELHGKTLEGTPVIAPDQLCHIEFDYVVIAVHNMDIASDIEKRLETLGVTKEKIKKRTDLPDITNVFPKVIQGEKSRGLESWLREQISPKILVVSHDFSYTGIPVASQNMSLALCQMGCSCVLASSRMDFGVHIKDELREKEIPFMADLALAYRSLWFQEIIKQFDLVIVASIIQKDFLQMCLKNKVKTLLWIHESDDKYYEDTYLLPDENLYVYGGGHRVLKKFAEIYPDIPMKCLQYYLPETASLCQVEKRDTIVFCYAATIMKRKGPDLLVEAIAGMPDAYRGKFVCKMVGGVEKTDFWTFYAEKVKDIKEIVMKGIVGQAELDELIENSDVFLCPSRDDPMPIVVTQAMMHKKFCIISDNVGQAEYIVQEENGFVFQSENVEQLREYMMWVIDHPMQLNHAANKSREIYDREFSVSAMMRNMKGIMKEMKV